MVTSSADIPQTWREYDSKSSYSETSRFEKELNYEYAFINEYSSGTAIAQKSRTLACSVNRNKKLVSYRNNIVLWTIELAVQCNTL